MSALSSQLQTVAKQLDFSNANKEALQTINKDVEDATHGLIKQLLSQIEQTTRLVLVNAVYFKGGWQKPFDKDATNENGQFNLAKDGKVVKVAMMSRNDKWPYYLDKATNCKAVQLDYHTAESNIAMVLILPSQGVSLATFIKSQLTATLLEQILDNLYSSGDVQLKLPRFKLTGSHKLSKACNSLGIQDIFSQANANLSHISTDSNFFVSEILQKAVIEVNEEGTKAAAATVVLLLGSSRFKPEPKEFIANRPFLYALVTKQSPRQILFIGAVEDPTKE